MKILIMGAGRVGTSVAENLVSEQNDITVIDTDVGQLRYLQDRFDLRVVQGDGIQVSVLESAGADDTDLFIACAASDAANLVACKIAREVFNVPRRIARIRMPEFADHPELMSDEGFAIDALISPERSVTTYLHSLIEFPEALQVVEFAGGRVSVITVRWATAVPWRITRSTNCARSGRTSRPASSTCCATDARCMPGRARWWRRATRSCWPSTPGTRGALCASCARPRRPCTGS